MKKSSYIGIPFTIEIANTFLRPTLNAKPDFRSFKTKICYIANDIEDLYRKDSLHFIQVPGMLDFDLVKINLPEISNRVENYLESLADHNFKAQLPMIVSTELVAGENSIFTNVYFRTIVNSLNDFNKFNYAFENHVVNSTKNISQMINIDSMPNVSILGDISQNKLPALINSLKNYWKKCN